MKPPLGLAVVPVALVALVSLACGDRTALELTSGLTDATAASACGGAITFSLAVEGSGQVFYGGPQPPWPSQPTCPGWLTVYHDGAPVLLTANGCDLSCATAPAVDPVTQTFTWDGVYAPYDGSAGFGQRCATTRCASAGDYSVTFCVAASLSSTGRDEAPPTCTTVPFTWPPTTADHVISVAITPTADAG